jgi:hypothetical protein
MFSFAHTAVFRVAQTQITTMAAGLGRGRTLGAGMGMLTCPPAAHS